MIKIKKIILILILFLLTLFSTSGVLAASLKVDPNSVSSSAGNNFDVKVILDPGSDAIYSTDIYLTYDQSLLKVVSVKAENLFPTVTHDESTSGKVYIAAMVNDPTSSISSSGTVATITFQGLKDGSGNLSFDCSNSKVIKNDANATNVLNCSQNVSSSVTIGSGSSNTSSNTNNSSTNLTSLPQTGIFENVVKFAIPGIILLFLGSALRFII
jgi:hypothetical protein